MYLSTITKFLVDGMALPHSCSNECPIYDIDLYRVGGGHVIPSLLTGAPESDNLHLAGKSWLSLQFSGAPAYRREFRERT